MLGLDVNIDVAEYLTLRRWGSFNKHHYGNTNESDNSTHFLKCLFTAGDIHDKPSPTVEVRALNNPSQDWPGQCETSPYPLKTNQISIMHMELETPKF